MADRQNPPSGQPPRSGGYRAGGARRLAAGADRKPYKRPRPAHSTPPVSARRPAHSAHRARRAAFAGSAPARAGALPRPVLFGLAALILCLVCAAGVWLARNAGGPAAPAQGRPDTAEWPAQVGDTLRQGPAERIVSLSPMATEALLCLPGRSALAGVTEYCDARNTGLPTVGTPLLPDPEEILALSPDVVVCQAPLSGEVAARLAGQGVEIVTLPTPQDLAALREYYAQLGALLHGGVTGRAEGGAVIDRFTAALGRYAAAIGTPASALLLPDLSGLAATADTAEWAVLGRLFCHPAPQAAGWLLPAGEGDGLEQPDALEGVRLADPDLLLLPDTVTPEELAAAGLENLRAVQAGRVVYLDLRLVETLSPRLIRPLAEAANLAYPDLAPPAPTPQPEG